MSIFWFLHDRLDEELAALPDEDCPEGRVIKSRRYVVNLHQEPHFCAEGEGDAEHPCPTLLLLALPYADHPAYPQGVS